MAVLAGGLSLEREVSLRSGHRVASALQDQGYDAYLLDVDSTLVSRLDGVDVAFLALHGKIGEDGGIQSLLDLLGVAYTGSGVATSSIAWNKPIAKSVLRQAGVRTPDFVVLSKASFLELGARSAIDRIVDVFGLPVVVKPATGGSALGVRRVVSAQDLPGALANALAYADAVIVERHVAGTEVGVSFLLDENLPAVEIAPTGDFYDYAARYTSGGTVFRAPPRLDAAALADAMDTARHTMSALGARQLGRVDLIVDRDGQAWVLELATCPGFTETSVWPLAVDTAGIGFGKAVAALVDATAA